MQGDLRSEFPLFTRVSYLNAGSVGPMPAAASRAAAAELHRQVTGELVGIAQFEHQAQLADRLRGRVARLLGCDADEVALTGATTDGVNAVLGGLGLLAGDEVLTSDEEHPGLLAPLALARERHGIEVRVAPFDELAGAVSSATRLVACSHVSWHTGKAADTAALGALDIPLLLDGAQGLGAVPVDVRELGCDFYAASGQKWLCGPIGSGYLYVRSELIGDLWPIAPAYGSLADPLKALELDLKPGAARFDGGLPSAERAAWALASIDVLEAVGIAAVHERAAELADWLATRLSESGRVVAPRGRTTLVSWESAENEAEAKRLAEEGLTVRHLPGTPYVRASVGAWSSEEELERLATSTS